MDERPAVGILAGEFALAHDAVRKSSRALRDRIYRRLAREFAPAAVRDIVRGATVASDTLIEALITSSGERQYELFAPPKLVDHFAARMRERFNHRPGKAAYVIRSTAELADGSCRLTPAAWLTPSGDWVSSLRIRRDFASRLYPVTAVAHGFGLHHMLHTAFLRLLLVGALECDSIVSGTRASRQALLNVLGHVADGFNAEFGTRLSYRGRTDVVPLCVDTERLRPREKMPLRSILGLPRDAFVVMYVGRLSPSKGDWFPFVKMFSSLVARNPGRKLLLVMCGTQAGAYANRLRDYGRSLGILANLRFKLDFPDSAKEQLIPAADAFVSVSDTVNETFGLAPVEAMACGIPQVVSDWDGYRETVVHNETGFLVPTYWTRCSGDLATTGPLLGTDYENLCIGHSIATDMGDFAGFLQVLMDNAELRARMGQRSRARAIELYSYKAAASRYDALWSELERIARKLALNPPRGQFEKPDYHKFFAHYASHDLGGEAQVRPVMSSARAESTLEALLAISSPGEPKVLDSALLRRALSEVGALAAAAGHDGFLTINDLVTTITPGEGACRDRLLRHVMWLVKYGFLEPAEGKVRVI